MNEPGPSAATVLVLCYGNPGRLDDGLGPALAAAVERLEIPGVTVDSDYQLSVENAADIAEHDAVVFADASVSAPDPFTFERIEPSHSASFTTHSLLPADLVGLAQSLFHTEAPAYVLAIRGHEFNEFEERLSAKAQENFAAAIEFITRVLREGSFEENLT